MATAAQTTAKDATAYQRLVWRLADHFEPGDNIHVRDIPALTDDDLAVCLNHESGIALDACRPAAYAEILNSAVLLTQQARIDALGHYLHVALIYEARDFLLGDIQIELANREQRYDCPIHGPQDDADCARC